MSHTKFTAYQPPPLIIETPPVVGMHLDQAVAGTPMHHDLGACVLRGLFTVDRVTWVVPGATYWNCRGAGGACVHLPRPSLLNNKMKAEQRAETIKMIAKARSTISILFRSGQQVSHQLNSPAKAMP